MTEKSVVKDCKFLNKFSHKQDKRHKKALNSSRIQGSNTSFRSRTLQKDLFCSHCKSFR